MDDATGDPGVALGCCWCMMAKISKGVAVVELFNFQLLRVWPLGVPILLINELCLGMIPGNLTSTLVDQPSPAVLESGLVDHAPKLLHVDLAAFPAVHVK